MMQAPMPTNEAHRLKDLCSFKILDSLPEEKYDSITDLAAHICEVPTALISIVDENRQWFKSRIGLDASETPRNISFCGYAVLSTDLMEIPDTLEDTRFKDNPLVIDKPFIRFYAGAPIISPSGNALGTLCVIDIKPRKLTERQKKSLVQLAQQVMTQMELKRTAATLEQRHAFHESLLNSTSSIVIASNHNGLITHFNATAEKVFGMPTNAVLGKMKVLDLINKGEVLSRKKALLDKSERAIVNDLYALLGEARNGQIERQLWTMRDRANKPIDVDLTITPLKDENDEFNGYLYVAQDITEEKRDHEALYLEKTRLEGVIKGTNAGTWEWNISTGEIIVNQRWAEIMGYMLEELTPISFDTWRVRVHPDDIAQTESRLKDHLEGKTSALESQFRVKHKEGHWVWIETYGKILNRENNGSPRMMYGIHNDISVRKKIECKLQQQTAQLEVLVEERTAELATNVSFVNSLIESSPDCLKVLSLDAKLLYMTEQGCAIMEVDNFCDIEGADWISFWSERDKPLVLKALSEAKAGRQGRFQAMTPTMKGTKKWWDVILNPITKKNKEIVKILSVSRDISHQKALEIELRDLNSDLETRIEKRTSELALARETAESANQAKTAFLTNMSHEIRTPLNAIIGMSELLEQTQDEEERARILKLSRESAHALLGIICDILDLSKIEAGQLDLNLEPMSLPTAFKFAADLFEQTAKAKGLYLHTEFDTAIPNTVECDPLRLRQILFNLLGNAIKFTEKGGVTFKAKLETNSTKGTFVRIDIEDTGIGIAQPMQDEIFKPFVQEANDTSKRFGGTGLGLSISRKLAELLDGKLTLQSTAGTGTCMTVTLPLREIEKNEDNTINEHIATLEKTDNIVPDSVKNSKILIADDNATNRALLQNQLRMIGCDKVDVACDGLEALSKWCTGDYDLLICDCQMPKMDGYDVAQHVREISALRPKVYAPPIIGYTADAMKETRTRCLNAGMSDVLIKPVGLKTLKTMMIEWLKPERRKNGIGVVVAASPIDWEALDESTGGNREFARDLLLGFVASRKKHLARLEEMIRTGNRQGLLEVTHKIKGAALGLSAKPLAQTCHLIETAAQQGDESVVLAGKNLLEADFARIMELLDN